MEDRKDKFRDFGSFCVPYGPQKDFIKRQSIGTAPEGVIRLAESDCISTQVPLERIRKNIFKRSAL